MIKKFLLSLALVVIPAISVMNTQVLAAGSGDVIKGGINDVSGGSPDSSSTLDSKIKSAINLLTVAVGIAAVVMIIVAGLKYITSGGNAEKTKSAKNTLLYAAVGLVIVALAQTIAHFVLTEAANPSTGTASSPPPPGGPPASGPQNTGIPPG